MNRTAALKIGFLLAFLLLCSILSRVGMRLVLPKLEWIEIAQQIGTTFEKEGHDEKGPFLLYSQER